MFRFGSSSCESSVFGVRRFYNCGFFGIPVAILSGSASSPRWRPFRVPAGLRREGELAQEHFIVFGA